jgi:hypothetical protein
MGEAKCCGKPRSCVNVLCVHRDDYWRNDLTGYQTTQGLLPVADSTEPAYSDTAAEAQKRVEDHQARRAAEKAQEHRFVEGICVRCGANPSPADFLGRTPSVCSGVLDKPVNQNAAREPAYSDTKPAYYNAGSNDSIAFILAHGIGAVEFTIMKYVMRWKGKDGLKDLRKVREYLDRLIAHVEAEELAMKQGGVSLTEAQRG